MHVNITFQDLIDILVKDNVNAYKQLDMTHEKLSSLRHSVTANQFSLPAEFHPRTVSYILRGPRDDVKYLYYLLMILGAVKTFHYEFRKMYTDTNIAKKIRYAYESRKVDLVNSHIGLIEWLMTRAIDPKLDWYKTDRSANKQKLWQGAILLIIAMYVPTGELILSALGDIIDRKNLLFWSNQERKRIEMTYPVPIVEAYVSQIGTTRPGFSYEKIQELIERESQRVKVYMFEMREVIRRAHLRNARRTSARFAMDQLRIRNKTTGATQRLPDEIVNKILRKAKLSHVNATTPLTDSLRLMERERNRKHMLHIIKGIKKRKRNFWD